MIENRQWNLNPIHSQRNDNLTRYKYTAQSWTGDALDIDRIPPGFEMADCTSKLAL